MSGADAHTRSRVSAALDRLSGSRPQASPVATVPAVVQANYQTIEVFAWRCSSCNRDCLPIRSESRCLCGHRLKDHANDNLSACRCKQAKCACRTFFYIPAEGSWILKCRCKHRHTDHDPNTHACSKSACECDQFSSPWVCNCNHPWDQHTQVLVQKQVPTMQALMANAQLADAAVLSELSAPHSNSEVNRWDLILRGDS